MSPLGFHLLDQKQPGSPGELETILEKVRGETGGPKIRCPLCKWRPRKEDRWGCRCGTSWNTFDTRGKCPGCGFQWHVTQCLQCHQYSRHEDWYAPPEPESEPS